MFKLSQSASFFWPVTVHIPTDGGKFSKDTFDAEFRRLDMAQLDELTARYRNFSSDNEQETKDAVREILVGWKGVVEDDGQAIPFSEDALEKLLGIPQARVAILRAFREAMSGEAKRKN